MSLKIDCKLLIRLLYQNIDSKYIFRFESRMIDADNDSIMNHVYPTFESKVRSF